MTSQIALFFWTIALLVAHGCARRESDAIASRSSGMLDSNLRKILRTFGTLREIGLRRAVGAIGQTMVFTRILRAPLTAIFCTCISACGGITVSSSSVASGAAQGVPSGSIVGTGANTSTDASAGGGHGTSGDGTASAPFLKPSWSKHLGQGAAQGAAYDPFGNLVVTGDVFGAFDTSVTSEAPPNASCSSPFVSPTAGAGCDPDGFLASFDPTGRTRWVNRWVGTAVVGPPVTADAHFSFPLSAPATR